MTSETERADTRMMGIVHGALRRDLLRTRDALTEEPYPHPAVPRFILLNGFARAYRRRAQVRWQSGSPARQAVAR